MALGFCATWDFSATPASTSAARDALIEHARRPPSSWTVWMDTSITHRGFWDLCGAEFGEEFVEVRSEPRDAMGV
jgi:hypothetical protein